MQNINTMRKSGSPKKLNERFAQNNLKDNAKLEAIKTSITK